MAADDFVIHDPFEHASPRLQKMLHLAGHHAFPEGRSGTDTELAEAREMYLVAADQAETEHLDAAARQLRAVAREMNARLWARHHVPGIRESLFQNVAPARSRRRRAHGHYDRWLARDGTEARLFRIASPHHDIHFVIVNDRGEVRPA